MTVDTSMYYPERGSTQRWSIHLSPSPSSGKNRRHRMMARSAVVTDSESASSRSMRDQRSPRSAATDSRLHEAARLVISPDGHADDASLQAAFKLLRAEAPVLWVDTPGMRPFWLLSRHGDISTVERRGAPFIAAPRTFLTSRTAEERLERMLGQPYVLRGLLQMDDPDHAAYRAVAQPWLSPAALAAMEPWLESWADHIVSRIAGRAEAYDEQILKLSWGLVGPEDPVRRLADDPTTAICRAGLGFQAYFDPVAADRRACPRHDLSSVIATAEVQGEPMPDYERFSYYAMIATGGHDTIAFCLSGRMHALIEHPDQLARLRVDPSLIDTAIEEMLRWTTPGRHIVRTATEDVELSGHTIRAGEAVALFFNSANRDETVFADGDKFRI